MNCTHAVVAHELRRRGYNVIAKPLPDELLKRGGRTHTDYLSRWVDPATGAPPVLGYFGNSKKLREEIKRSPGSRWAVVVQWRKNDAGHVFIAENVNGKVRFIDPQSGELAYAPFSRVKQGHVWAYRIDTLEPKESLIDFVEEDL